MWICATRESECLVEGRRRGTGLPTLAWSQDRHKLGAATKPSRQGPVRDLQPNIENCRNDKIARQGKGNESSELETVALISPSKKNSQFKLDPLPQRTPIFEPHQPQIALKSILAIDKDVV